MISGTRKAALWIIPHLAAILAIALCVRLAFWQLDRAEEKASLLSQWETAAAVSLTDDNDNALPRYTRVSASGRFDPDRHIFLDNQIRNNHTGVHVFSLFEPADSDRLYLVNRGWQPWQRNSGRWPEFDTPATDIVLTGRINEPPRPGVRLGQAEPLDVENWPNLMTYLELDLVENALDRPVAEQIILLDPDHPAHLSGDPWALISMGPERHRGYAFQWASIAIALVVIWSILTLKNLFKRGKAS